MLNIPTLLIHGYVSDLTAEQPLINQLQQKAQAHLVLKILISSDNHFQITQFANLTRQHALIAVGFADNRQYDILQSAAQLHALLRLLYQKYHLRGVNCIAHSRGNQVVMAEWLYYQHQQCSRLVKYVALGGNFNGTLHYDEPLDNRIVKCKPAKMTTTYQRLLTWRHSLTMNDKLQVLNIYGDLGNGDDHQVSVTSARSLHYLLRNHLTTYQELMLALTHQQLFTAKQSAQAITNFLWN